MKLYFNGPKSIFHRVKVVMDFAPIEPSYASSLAVQPRTLKVQYGDGYEQRVPEGINNLPLNLRLVFANRSKVITQELKRFFIGHPPVYDRQIQEYFYFTPPEPWATEGKYVIEGDVGVTFNQANSFTTTVNIRQVFEP